MRYVRLGKTDLEVSAIAFGTWAFGGDWGSFDAHEAKAAIFRALDLGITFFDTAHAYGFGLAERLLGGALHERGSLDRVILATKGGLRKEGDAIVRDASAAEIRLGVERSLRNLRVDHIDLFLVHWPDPSTPADETAEALERLVAQGKIRHVGVSNYDKEQMDSLARCGARVESLQPAYHMFRREIELETLPYCIEHDIGVLVYGTLAHGLLTGHVTPDTAFDPDDWRSRSPDFTGETFRKNLEVVEALKEFAQERLVLLGQLAVAWTLAHPAVDVAIVGARRASQLEQTAPAADIGLSEGELCEIDRILTKAVPIAAPNPVGM
jgi:aryl-alcohol dehydrogenase-like predicted oxidoreductase